ncbi:predicted protein [Thalassiosira pseudonana CCMP1335]|uniref:Uncharacterized protein n=1 Tax=Thalassiosira pseudonana TaxID=35128 RepID=B8BWT7_THAPS|nr:predicted protein [Thalassiosira pseudonana CCMP1335]EED94091.1 predicted protein [Thalassiosira pseudonana CCMP1335]
MKAVLSLVLLASSTMAFMPSVTVPVRTWLDGGAPQYRRRCFRVGMARSAAWTNERGSSTTPPHHAVASFGSPPTSLHVKDSTTICNTTLPGNMILGQTRRFIPGGGSTAKFNTPSHGPLESSPAKLGVELAQMMFNIIGVGEEEKFIVGQRNEILGPREEHL